jgi:flavin reductase (DIM6/NTAB) family NADH-FMN oxidoreductase RutF
MAKRSFPLSEVYRLLEPGPVVMVTTAGALRPNVMTMSWNVMIDFEPPLVGLIISNRNFTFHLLRRTKECAINIPTARIARKVVACGNCSGRDTDKFEAVGLTAVPAARIKAPLIEECFANLECKVVDARLAGKYNFFVVKVVKAWIDPGEKNPRMMHHHGKGVFTFDGRRVRLPSRMP